MMQAEGRKVLGEVITWGSLWLASVQLRAGGEGRGQRWVGEWKRVRRPLCSNGEGRVVQSDVWCGRKLWGRGGGAGNG